MYYIEEKIKQALKVKIKKYIILMSVFATLI